MEGATFFYTDKTNELRVATSIAKGHRGEPWGNPEWASHDIQMYEQIEMSTVVLQVNFWTQFETREVKGCRAVGHDGKVLMNRWKPEGRPEGDGLLMLSL